MKTKSQPIRVYCLADDPQRFFYFGTKVPFNFPLDLGSVERLYFLSYDHMMTLYKTLKKA